MRSATWRGSRLSLSSELMSSSRRSSPARSCDRSSSRADSIAGRRLIGQDREHAQVVLVELVQTELGQGDDPEGRLVVAHRHDEHGFLDLLGARDGRAAWIVVRVADEQRPAVLGHPAGEALSEPAAKEFEVDLLVGAHRPFEGDRDDGVRFLHEVDPGIVVIDDPAGLLDDRPADLVDRGRATEPRGGGLEHGQLGGPRLRLGEQLGVGQRDRGMRGERGDERDVAVGPRPRLTSHRHQGPDDLVVVHERRDQVSGELEDPLVARVAVAGVGPNVRPGAGRDRSAGPRRTIRRHAGTAAGGPRPRRSGRPTPRARGGRHRGSGSSWRPPEAPVSFRRRSCGTGPRDRVRPPGVLRCRGRSRVVRRVLPPAPLVTGGCAAARRCRSPGRGGR